MRSTGAPPLNRMRHGMPDTSYCAARFGLSSVSSLTTLRRPLYWSATLSTIGAIILHGPHQSAQKSTRTGSDDLRTSASKLPWLTACAELNVVSPYSARFEKRATVLMLETFHLLRALAYVGRAGHDVSLIELHDAHALRGTPGLADLEHLGPDDHTF